VDFNDVNKVLSYLNAYFKLDTQLVPLSVIICNNQPASFSTLRSLWESDDLEDCLERLEDIGLIETLFRQRDIYKLTELGSKSCTLLFYLSGQLVADPNRGTN